VTTAKLRRVGGSVMLAIPPAALDELHLSAGSSVDIVLEGGKLAISPARKRYMLDELLAQCDPDAPFSQEDRAWLNDAPVGREII
jgi:antitoxin ChpS